MSSIVVPPCAETVGLGLPLLWSRETTAHQRSFSSARRLKIFDSSNADVSAMVEREARGSLRVGCD